MRYCGYRFARVNPAFLEDLRNEVNLYMIPIQEPKHTKQK